MLLVTTNKVEIESILNSDHEGYERKRTSILK